MCCGSARGYSMSNQSTNSEADTNTRSTNNTCLESWKHETQRSISPLVHRSPQCRGSWPSLIDHLNRGGVHLHCGPSRPIPLSPSNATELSTRPAVQCTPVAQSSFRSVSNPMHLEFSGKLQESKLKFWPALDAVSVRQIYTRSANGKDCVLRE